MACTSGKWRDLRPPTPYFPGARPLTSGSGHAGHTESDGHAGYLQPISSGAPISSPSSCEPLDGDGSELPALAFVAGESGVGKSRLLTELIEQRRRAQGIRTLGGALHRARRRRAALCAAHRRAAPPRARRRSGSRPRSPTRAAPSSRGLCPSSVRRPRNPTAIAATPSACSTPCSSWSRRWARSRPRGCCCGSRTSIGPTARPARSCASSAPAVRDEPLLDGAHLSLRRASPPPSAAAAAG